MKKVISFLVALILFSTTISLNYEYIAFSEIAGIAEYTGLYNGHDFKFKIYNIDYENKTFIGYLYTNNEFVTIDQPINGEVALKDDNYVCTFNFSYSWFITTYDALFYIAIYPEKGEAIGNGGGGILFADTDFPLTGTIDKFFFSYNERDMKLCMDLSYTIYNVNKENDGENAKADTTASFINIVEQAGYIVVNNYAVIQNEFNDRNPDNVEFAVLNRKIDDDTIDIIVVIRGTLDEEWNGNVQITGTSYNEEQKVHDNFNKQRIVSNQK